MTLGAPGERRPYGQRRPFFRDDLVAAFCCGNMLSRADRSGDRQAARAVLTDDCIVDIKRGVALPENVIKLMLEAAEKVRSSALMPTVGCRVGSAASLARSVHRQVTPSTFDRTVQPLRAPSVSQRRPSFLRRRTAQVELKGGAVRFMDFWGDIHAQHTLLSHHGGRACDCLYFER